MFDLDRLMAYPITSYDCDFNLDLNPQYVPMGEWLRQISREWIFTFLATLQILRALSYVPGNLGWTFQPVHLYNL